MITPFSLNEQEAWDHLSAAHAAFVKLTQTHPSHAQKWVDGIHACQDVLGSRVIQRDHPTVFATYINGQPAKAMPVIKREV